MDASELVLLATLVQTVVITLTLLVFIFQFRSQEKAVKESSYQNLLVGVQSVHHVGGHLGQPSPGAAVCSGSAALGRQAGRIRRLMIAYGIIEEAYELYSKKWIDKATWNQWDAWLSVIARYPQFTMLHESTLGMFDKEFQDYVSRMIESRK